jgi:hypothetical protein
VIWPGNAGSTHRLVNCVGAGVNCVTPVSAAGGDPKTGNAVAVAGGGGLVAVCRTAGVPWPVVLLELPPLTGRTVTQAADTISGSAVKADIRHRQPCRRNSAVTATYY